MAQQDRRNAQCKAFERSSKALLSETCRARGTTIPCRPARPDLNCHIRSAVLPKARPAGDIPIITTLNPSSRGGDDRWALAFEHRCTNDGAVHYDPVRKPFALLPMAGLDPFGGPFPTKREAVKDAFAEAEGGQEEQ